MELVDKTISPDSNFSVIANFWLLTPFYLFIVCVCVWERETTCQKYLATLKNFLILKVLFFMKQVKHHNYAKYKSSWAKLNTN